MPKPDKKRSKKDSTSDSDSGPDDRSPVKKSKSIGEASGSGHALPGDEPSWLLSGMKFVKVGNFFFSKRLGTRKLPWDLPIEILVYT